jgi:dipeptidyl aminopeptidase/acylaminoacyl peptidase
MKRRLRRLAVATTWWCVLGSAGSTAAEPPPVLAYASLPAFAEPRLSPDGHRMAVLRPLHDVQHAFVMDLTSGHATPLLAADPSQHFINHCDWANADRLVCSIRIYGEIQTGQNYTRYRDNRTTFTRMIAVDADGGSRMRLIPPPVNREAGEQKWNPVDQDDVISWMRQDPEHILVQLNRDDRVRPSVYRLNIYTNELKRVRQSHDTIYRWYADPQGNLRFAVGYRNFEPVAFSVSGNRAVPVDVSHFADVYQPSVIGATSDGKRAYAGSYYGGNRYRIHEVDVKSGQVVRALFADPDYDIFGGRLLLDERTNEPLLLEYYQERLVRHWFDSSLGEQIEKAASALGALHDTVSVIDLTPDAERSILLASGKGTVPTYYFFNAPKGELKRIGSTYPDIAEVVEPEIIHYDASDGRPITAYLTVPPGDPPFPAVLLPHGGPYARDYPSFHPWVQFLVSRGYAVIQPNFRGSVGYGLDHLSAGFKQWGLKMQDDVMDALDWMIGAKLADPDRVCVVGGSYGGYVALIAAYKTPDRIRCAVSFAGVTDLLELKKHTALYDLGVLTLERIQDGPSVNDNSPIAQVDRIGVPLLIVHGDADRSVMIEQSRSFVAALDKAGKPYRYIEQPDGDHYLSNQSHRVEFFEALEDFLRENLQ